MEIRLISSLTAEDENLFAPVLVKTAAAILDHLRIAYTIRIETTGALVFQHTHSASAEGRNAPADTFRSLGQGEHHSRQHARTAASSGSVVP